MKVLTVALALAIFAGSLASVSSEEKPASRLDLLKERLNKYFRDLRRPFDEQEDLIRQTKVYKEVREQALESYFNISRRFRKLGREIPSEVEEIYDLALGIPTGVLEKLYRVLREFSRRLEPATRDLYNALEPIVASRVEPALEKVKPYADMVHTRIQEIGENQTERLKARLRELETLGPEITYFLEQLEEFQVDIQPFVDELQGLITQKVEDVVSIARPYVTPVLEAAREHTKDFKKWVSNQ